MTTAAQQLNPLSAELTTSPSSLARVRLSGHLPGLDGVRGLAILMVLGTHFIGSATASTLLQRLVVKASGYGVLGVDLFFVLSGFLITGLLLRAKGRPHYFRNFYARRTLRIFPLYYGALVVLFIVLPQFVAPSPMLREASRHQAWLWTYTTNIYIAMIASWNSLTYVNHFWSLAVEEHFYLLWPLVVFSVTRPTLERICVGVVLGGLALRIALAMQGVNELSISVLTPCRIDTLAVGGLLATVAHRENGVRMLLERARTAAIVLGLSVLVVSIWCAATDIGLPLFHQVRVTLYAGFFGALVLLSLHPEAGLITTVFENRALRFFGKYSYGLYVYHAVLLWYFLDYGVEARVDAVLGNHSLTIATVAVLGTGISTLVAIASYRFFEQHLLALKRFFDTIDIGAASGQMRVDEAQR